jgi:flagellar hook-associated protein 1 FlgK
MSLINTGLTGLKAHQTALAVTGNNVTNANTEGYTRQRVELADSNSQFIGAGYLGTGVDITNIKRLTDEYLTAQVRIDQSVFAEVEKLRVNVSQIDSLLADPTTGLSPAMSGFFGALQSAADDPASVPERQLVLTQAQGLTNRFSVLYNRLDSQARGIDQDMRAQVDRLNSLASGLAKVNQAIASSQGNAQGRLPNDLLDQRDTLLKELSKIVNVTTIAGADGQTNVLIGSGQTLVVGNRASQLSVDKSEEDPTKLDVLLSENGQANVITRELAGGSLGGVIHFRDHVLSEAFNSLGRIALVLADTINEQHQLGMDLEGKFGADFFEDINSEDNQAARVFGKEGNALPNDRVLRVEIMDSSIITTKDYQVQFAGPSDTDILVTDALTGEKITRGKLTGFLPATFEFEGVRLNFESGSFQEGDSFRVSPTRFGARDVDMNITRVESIALGSPIRTDSDLGNIGNARISAGELLDVKSPITGEVLPAFAVPGELTPPLLVRFIADDYYEVLDNTDTSNPIPLVPPKKQ